MTELTIHELHRQFISLTMQTRLVLGKIRNHPDLGLLLISDEDTTSTSSTSEAIDKLRIPTRTINCLKGAGVYTIDDLIQKTETDLLRIGNLGRRTINQVKEALEDIGLSLSTRNKLETDEVFTLNVFELGISVRAANSLKAGNITSVGDLIKKTRAEILDLPNIGKKTLEKIEARLADLDLELKQTG